MFNRTKPEDVLTLPLLTDWLRTQDPNRSYEYHSGSTCLLAQFLKAKGFKRLRVGVTYGIYKTWGGWVTNHFPIPGELNRVAMGGRKGDHTRTFGGALAQAELEAKPI